MRIHFGNHNLDKLAEASQNFPTQQKRDDFTYLLLGMMSCYLDEETLDACIANATRAAGSQRHVLSEVLV
jgi:hypothetical protein